jgi:hypothetical protein
MIKGLNPSMGTGTKKVKKEKRKTLEIIIFLILGSVLLCHKCSSACSSPGPNFIKLFTSVIYKFFKYPRVCPRRAFPV